MEDNVREPLATLPVSSGTKHHCSEVGAAWLGRAPRPPQWLQAENPTHQHTPPPTKPNAYQKRNSAVEGEHLSSDTREKKRQEERARTGN